MRGPPREGDMAESMLRSDVSTTTEGTSTTMGLKNPPGQARDRTATGCDRDAEQQRGIEKRRRPTTATGWRYRRMIVASQLCRKGGKETGRRRPTTRRIAGCRSSRSLWMDWLDEGWSDIIDVDVNKTRAGNFLELPPSCPTLRAQTWDTHQRPWSGRDPEGSGA